jgi:hypothetical protein
VSGIQFLENSFEIGMNFLQTAAGSKIFIGIRSENGIKSWGIKLKLRMAPGISNTVQRMRTIAFHPSAWSISSTYASADEAAAGPPFAAEEVEDFGLDFFF